MTLTPFQSFLQSKGIREDTAARWGVEDHGNEAHFKYPKGVKIRGNLDGSAPRTFKYSGESSLYRRGERLSKTVFVTEGESDCLRLDQEFQDRGYGDKVSVVGVSGVNGWKKEYGNDFSGVERIRCILDNDEDYSVRATVDKAYGKMAADLGRGRTRRIYLPDGTKDICQFFRGYSFDSFLTIAKPSSQTNYNRLDLDAEPPVAEWLVEGLICSGDVTLLTGPANVGKSMISAALAVAVGEGTNKFLGEPLHVPSEGAPVLYVDEENPLDQAYSRLLGLGMTDKGKKNIHYYHSQGVRLDRSPEKILDDAMIVRPKLVVFDAITRMHSNRESDSGDINTLFNEAIIPIARQTGAAVIVIHADKKGDHNDLEAIRGSSDFAYAVDNAIRIKPTVAVDTMGIERPALDLVHSKSRRTKKGAKFKVFMNFGITGDIEMEVATDGF